MAMDLEANTEYLSHILSLQQKELHTGIVTRCTIATIEPSDVTPQSRLATDNPPFFRRPSVMKIALPGSTRMARIWHYYHSSSRLKPMATAFTSREPAANHY
eukprot:3852046-Amphidinium_carterae.1